jgi:hypothetical protein
VSRCAKPGSEPHVWVLKNRSLSGSVGCREIVSVHPGVARGRLTAKVGNEGSGEAKARWGRYGSEEEV